MVGHDEHPLSPVRGTNVVSTHHERPDGVAFRLQVFDNPVSSESSEAMNVLSADPTGSHLSHDPEHLGPEPSLIVVAAPFASARHWLAGKPSDEDINSGNRSC